MEPLQNPNPNPTPLWANILKTNHTSASPNPHQREPAGPSATATAGRVVVGSCKSASGIAVAVVDANAIIQGGERLARSADKFVTVSEVIDEIRDPASRHSLHFLPFTVDTVEPSPESLNKVIQFARATGDLHTLSDVDLKLIALTYTLEAQIHGTNNLRHSPPPINMVNVKRLPEKDLPGWGSNVANLEEWEALDHVDDHGPDPNSKILPLEELNLNVISTGQQSTEGASTVTEGEPHAWSQEKGGSSFGRPRRHSPKKREVNVEGKKMVADGIDASQGEYDDNADDWQPAVSRSTHRRYLRRKAKREMYAASSKNDGEHAAENVEAKNFGETKCGDMLHECCEETLLRSENFEESSITEGQSSEDISTILEHLRLEEDSLNSLHNKEVNLSSGVLEELGEFSNDDDGCLAGKGDECDLTDQELEHLETSQNNESVCATHMDDDSSEHGWTVRSLSESTVACVTSDYAMQNVLLQMGLRLLAPGGMQIRELHRWILKCHACYKVTTEIGKIFCPSCGNGGTLRKVAVTVGENGIVLAAHRPRISLRGTKFSLPLPQGGREAITKNPILREDQLPKKFLYPKTKKKNKQGEDIFVSNDIFLHHTDKRAPLQPPVRKALAVFSGKRNPNDNRFSRSKR